MDEMNEQEYDQAWMAYQEVSEAITELVKASIQDLTDPQKNYVLDRLGESYRFWSAFE